MQDSSAPERPGTVTFVEPTEQAYRLDVPQGWNVQGGVKRTRNGATPWYRVLSPDGRAELRLDDPRAPLAYVYGGTLAPFIGSQPMTQVRPWVPASVFSEEYARQIGHDLGGHSVRVTASLSAEDVLARLQQPESVQNLRQSIQHGADLGGVRFECPEAGVSGLVSALCVPTPSMDTLIWNAFFGASFAPTEEWERLEPLLEDIGATYSLNPAWQQMQQQILADNRQADRNIAAINQRGFQQRMQIQRETADHLARNQRQMWENSQRASSENSRRFTNALTDVGDFRDASTGEVYRGIETGFDTYWSDGMGGVVGTNGFDNPDPSRYTQMQNLDDIPLDQRRDAPGSFPTSFGSFGEDDA